MPQTDFLPTQQSKLAAWARAFSQQVSADPAALGVSDADVAELAGRVATFRDDLAVALRTETQTRVTIAQKNTSRRRMTQTIRRVARIIRANPEVTQAMRVALMMIGGASRPVKTLVYPNVPQVSVMRLEPGALVVLLVDCNTPMRRAKPVDVAGALVFTHVYPGDGENGGHGYVPPPPMEQWRFCGIACRHEFRIPYHRADAGKRVEIRAAWFTRTGEIGKYSMPATAMVAA